MSHFISAGTKVLLEMGPLLRLCLLQPRDLGGNKAV